jgi:hypothetical protein
MRQAVEEQVHAGPFRDRLWEAVVNLADHMRSKPE